MNMAMLLDSPAPGFGLICDRTGVIDRFVHDELGLGAADRKVRLLSELLEPASWSKAQQFLQATGDGAAVNWELNTRIAQEVETLFFAGGRVREGILVCGARSRWRIDRSGARTPPADPQAHATRDAEDDREQAASPRKGEGHWFDELTRLNNEMATLQRELAKRNAELERLNEEKNRAIGVVAHDLRNPLSTIQLSSEVLLLASEGRLDEVQRDAIAAIQESSRFMLQLVNDVLDLSAIEAGKLRLDWELVDLASLVEDVAKRNRAIARDRQVEIACQTDLLKGPRVPADPVKLRQVLNNLLHNAVKFSPPGGVVGMEGDRTENSAVIAIRDQGPGMAAADVERLFRPFETSAEQDAKAHSGVGLGLAIVKRIIDGHGGKVEVQSEPGQGTTFRVSLLLERPSHEKGQAP